MKDNNGCAYWILIALFCAAIIALLFYAAYKISVSDLPPWFKFFLLRG